MTRRRHNPIPRLPASLGRRAFTLVELMVVVGIIIIVLAIAIPAIGPMLDSNEEAALVNTINGMLVSAQTAAQANGTKVALRFERAYAVNEDGIMIDANGCTPDNEIIVDPDAVDPDDRYDPCDVSFQGPLYLDHQQVRLAIFMASNSPAFRELPDSKPIALPDRAWVTPSFILSNDTTRSDDLYDSLVSNNLQRTYANKRSYNRMDTFYVAFGPDGELTVSPAGQNWLRDGDQSRFSDVSVFVGSPDDDPSALALLVYDREEFTNLDPSNGQGRLDYLARASRPIFINRATGALIEERPQ